MKASCWEGKGPRVRRAVGCGGDRGGGEEIFRRRDFRGGDRDGERLCLR